MKCIPLLLVVATLFSCGRPQVNIAEEKAKILHNWNDWGVKSKTGNLDSITYYWTDDAVVMSQGQPTVKGKENLKKMIAGMPKTPGGGIAWDTPASIEISADGQMAYLFARNVFSIPDSSGAIVKISNQAIQVWRIDKDGVWRSAVVMMYPER